MTLTGLIVKRRHYATRLSYYHQRIFQCEASGKSNLTYFEATESEAQHTLAIQTQFPQALKKPVLRLMQFQPSGSLADAVERVFDCMKQRFFVGEDVLVEHEGVRYPGVVRSGLCCRHAPSNEHVADNATAPASRPNSSKALHANLSLTEADAHADPPDAYEYTIEFEHPAKTKVVRAEQLSRERHALTKTILRRFLRDALCRDPYVGQFWLVREHLAHKHGLSSALPPAIQASIEQASNSHKRRRSEAGTDADSSAAGAALSSSSSNKRQAREPKKTSRADDKGAMPTSATAGSTLAAAMTKKGSKSSPSPPAPPPTPPKVLKFPCEDTLLDAMTHEELKVEIPGELPRLACRPVLGGEDQLNVPADVFEPFLTVYYFFLTLGEPLGISCMALDDLEGALRHPVNDPPCALLAEVHAVLLNAIVRDGAHSRDLAPAAIAQRHAHAAAHSTSASGPDENSTAVGNGDMDTPTSDAASDLSELSDSPERDVLDAAREQSRGWQRRELDDEHRSGWERHLVGCLVDRATPESLPRYLGILSFMTGVEYNEDDSIENGRQAGRPLRSAAERYPHLPLSDKVHILQFLCELAVLTRDVKAFYEECESHLTELRKERIELVRQRKRSYEQQQELEHQQTSAQSGGEQDAAGQGTENGDPTATAHASGSANDAELSQRRTHGRASADAGDEDDHNDGENGNEDDDNTDSERDELASDGDEPGGGDRDEEDASDADEQSDGTDGSDDGIDRKETDHYKRLAGTRQEVLREKALQREEEAERVAAEQARFKERFRETKQLRDERRRLAETIQRCIRREGAIEREFRRYAQIPRLRPLGRDRFLDRYYWLDGIGSAARGHMAYQTARIFVQSPSRRDWDKLCVEYADGRDALVHRRSGEHRMDSKAWSYGSWGVYSQPEQVEELIAWLRPQGVREHALKAQLLKHREAIEGGMRRRTDDIALGVREPAIETRRSTRMRSEQATQLRMPYMQWRNTARNA